MRSVERAIDTDENSYLCEDCGGTSESPRPEIQRCPLRHRFDQTPSATSPPARCRLADIAACRSLQPPRAQRRQAGGPNIKRGGSCSEAPPCRHPSNCCDEPCARACEGAGCALSKVCRARARAPPRTLPAGRGGPRALVAARGALWSPSTSRHRPNAIRSRTASGTTAASRRDEASAGCEPPGTLAHHGTVDLFTSASHAAPTKCADANLYLYPSINAKRTVSESVNTRTRRRLGTSRQTSLASTTAASSACPTTCTGPSLPAHDLLTS